MLSIEQLQTTSLMYVQVTPDCAKGLVFSTLVPVRCMGLPYMLVLSTQL